jgi:NAD(P)-dependent dehydrogenase (short-subunit alcohol dehydrogenase family)
MASRAVADPAIAAYLARKQPLGSGAGRPEDCAGAAVFLCGDESRFLTGVVLTVDGGWCVSEPDCPPADPPPGLTPRTDL